MIARPGALCRTSAACREAERRCPAPPRADRRQGVRAPMGMERGARRRVGRVPRPLRSRTVLRLRGLFHVVRCRVRPRRAMSLACTTAPRLAAEHACVSPRVRGRMSAIVRPDGRLITATMAAQGDLVCRRHLTPVWATDRLSWREIEVPDGAPEGGAHRASHPNPARGARSDARPATVALSLFISATDCRHRLQQGTGP